MLTVSRAYKETVIFELDENTDIINKRLFFTRKL